MVFLLVGVGPTDSSPPRGTSWGWEQRSKAFPSSPGLSWAGGLYGLEIGGGGAGVWALQDQEPHCLDASES